jgi:hypothetical protein
MVVWYVFLFAVLLTIAVCNILFPRRMWGLFKSWRFQNPDVVEPPDLVLWWYRGSSILGVILLVSVGIYGGMEYHRRVRCAEVLPELKRLFAAADASALKRRADELGLEVRKMTSGRYSTREKIVITDDGKPFATIWTFTGDAACTSR